MRLDYRILLRQDEDFHQVESLFLTVCPHWESFDRHRNLAKVLLCQLSRETNNPCNECTRMIQCRWCTTEFIVSVLDSTWSPNGRAIYIRAWKNLGPCQTPFDIRWRTHIQNISLPPKSLVPFTPDSIRSAFENFGSPKLKGDGIASVLPLDSDVEFSKRIDAISRRPTQSKQPGDFSEAIVDLPDYILAYRSTSPTCYQGVDCIM